VSEINFLRKNLAKLKKQSKQDKEIYQYALIFFSTVVIIFIGLLSYRIYLSSQLKSTLSKQDKTKQSINNQEGVEISFLVFTNKLKIIRNLFEERSDKQAAISYFSNLFGEGVYIEGMSFGGNGSTLSLTIASDNIFILENIFERLENPEIKEKFSFVNKSNLRREDTGKYSLSLTISLIKPRY
jgi:hypothetical protein